MLNNSEERKKNYLKETSELLERIDPHLYPHEKKMIKKWVEKIGNAPLIERFIYSEALSTLIKSITERVKEVREVKKEHKKT